MFKILFLPKFVCLFLCSRVNDTMFKCLDPASVNVWFERGREVKKRVQAGCNGWRRMSGVICDRRVLAGVKGKVYKVAVRPAMLFGLETVALTKRQEADMEVAALNRCYYLYEE